MESKAEGVQIPKIDLTGLHPRSPGWEATRGSVMDAIEVFGCFEALYADVSPELRDSLFYQAVPELFSLPLEAKMRNTSVLPHQAYLGQYPGMPYESLRFDAEQGQEFTRLMWPQGNPGFRDTVCTYGKDMKDMEHMVVRMIFQSMGLENYCKSHIESTTHAIRLSEYGVPLDQESKIALKAHADPNLVTIICQHQVEGLEVQTRAGEWIYVVPSPSSFTVMIGEAFEVWSIGRLKAPKHRVRMIGSEKRYSVLFSSRPGDGYVIHVPKELVDEEHPLLYKPFNYNNYLLFRFSEEGARAKNTLKAFCGEREEEEHA